MKKPKLRFTEGQDAFAVIAGDVFMPAVLQVQKFHIVQVVRDSHYLVKDAGNACSPLYTVSDICLFETEKAAHMWLAAYAGMISDRETKTVKQIMEQEKNGNSRNRKKRAKKTCGMSA